MFEGREEKIQRTCERYNVEERLHSELFYRERRSRHRGSKSVSAMFWRQFGSRLCRLCLEQEREAPEPRALASEQFHANLVRSRR